MRSDLVDVLWVPSLPEQGWPSMDVYWKVMEGYVDAAEESGYGVRMALDNAPDRSREIKGVRRALNKYYFYPRKVASLSREVVHVMDLSFAHVLKQVPKGVKTVVTAFDIIPMLNPGTLTQSQLKRFERSVGCARIADRVIAVSDQTREDLVEHVGVDPKKIVVVYPGTDVKRFATQVDGKIKGVSDESKVVFSLSSLDPKKNLESLIEVFRPLRDRFSSGELLFVRAGAMLSEEVRIRFEEVVGEVKELGPIFGDDLVRAYQRSDVFMMPSLYEGFSFTMMEAMAASCPVVSNRCTSNPEVGGDAVLYYEEGDSAAATAQVVRLIDDVDTYREMVELGGGRVEELSWDAHWEGIRRAYDGLLLT